jgi:hypothetical protein
MDAKYIAELFNLWAIGIGALFAGTAGAFLIWDRLEEIWLRRKIRNYRLKFPRVNLNKTFKLVDTDTAKGYIYLIDLEKRKKYWIQSAPTYLEMNFHWKDFQTINSTEFESYSEGEPILLRGDPLS